MKKLYQDKGVNFERLEAVSLGNGEKQTSEDFEDEVDERDVVHHGHGVQVVRQHHLQRQRERYDSAVNTNILGPAVWSNQSGQIFLEGGAAKQRRFGLEGRRFETRLQQGILTVESLTKYILPLAICMHNFM